MDSKNEARTCGDMDLKLPMISVNKRRLKGKDQSVADLADKRALTSRSLTPGCEKNLSGRSVKTWAILFYYLWRLKELQASAKIQIQERFLRNVHSANIQKHTRDEFTGATRVIRFPSWIILFSGMMLLTDIRLPVIQETIYWTLGVDGNKLRVIWRRSSALSGHYRACMFLVAPEE